jgi:hypothetical protein
MNELKSKITANIVIAVIVAVAIVAASLILVDGVKAVKGGSNRLIVTGSAKQEITSDLIVWTGNFSASSPNLREAYTALEAEKEAVSDYLVNQGVDKDEISFSSINTYTVNRILENGMYSQEIDHYELNQTVTISSSEVDKVTEISRNITELINEGVYLTSNAPQYMYTKIADLKVTMLAEATKDATNRAQMIAENAGSKLGKLKYADMGVIQITPRYSNEVSDYGMNDTYSLEKEITAIVHCEFEIE